MKTVVIVDDHEAFCLRWKTFLELRYGDAVLVETFTDPLLSLGRMRADIGLLILDLEMPIMDGKKVLDFAAQRGVDRRRIVVTSARDADYLHGVFRSGECLAVINKEDAQQQEAFLLILDSIMRKP